MRKLTSRTQGILWEVNAALVFTVLTFLVKTAKSEFPTPFIAFMRTILGTCLVVPFALVKGIERPKRHLIVWYLLRSLAGVGALNAIFYSYGHLPHSIATAISYMEPMIGFILSIIFFKVSIGWKQWFYMLLGYGGVFVIAYMEYYKEGGEFSVEPILIALAGCLLLSIVKAVTQHLTRHEPVHQVLFYSSILNCFFSLFVVHGSSCFPSSWPSLPMMGLLCGIAFFGILTQYSFSKAVSLTSMHIIGPITYLRLIFSLPLAYFIYGEATSWPVLVGSVIIIVANYFLLLSLDKK